MYNGSVRIGGVDGGEYLILQLKEFSRLIGIEIEILKIFFSLILVLCFVPEISRTTVVDISEEYFAIIGGCGCKCSHPDIGYRLTWFTCCFKS